jgi:hypothetical protein
MIWGIGRKKEKKKRKRVQQLETKFQQREQK